MSGVSSGSGMWGALRGVDGYSASSDASLFSSSLPVIFHEKLNFADSDSSPSLDDSSPNLNKLDLVHAERDRMEDVELVVAENLLPDDEDDLLGSIMDEFEIARLLNESDDVEECDIFGTGGGLEMDAEPQDGQSASVSNINLPDGGSSNGFSELLSAKKCERASVEHPYGEHPSRTLFVRNINSNVQDFELRALFEPYGDIRSLYTACKPRGFVMISYCDIRAACAAMCGLQNKLLRKRRLDIHFSIPKDKPSEKDMNQGTLMISNLETSVSNAELLNIFGAYGEIKEIRDMPQNQHQKFIEYYDVRDAEAALRALNRSEIRGKCIVLELSRPGGARRPNIPLPRQGLEGGEGRSVLNHGGYPVVSSPPGNWPHFGSSVLGKPSRALLKSPGIEILNPQNTNNLPGLASILPFNLSSSPNFPSIGGAGRSSHVIQSSANKDMMHNFPILQSHSYPDHKPITVSGTTPTFDDSSSSGFRTLSDSEFLWGSPPVFPGYATSSGSTSSAGHGFFSRGQGFLRGTYQHHVGSAPTDIHLDRRLGYFPQSPETSFTRSVGFGCMGDDRNYMMNVNASLPVGSCHAYPGRPTKEGYSGSRMIPLPKPLFFGNGNADFQEFEDGKQPETSGIRINHSSPYHTDLDKIKTWARGPS